MKKILTLTVFTAIFSFMILGTAFAQNKDTKALEDRIGKLEAQLTLVNEKLDKALANQELMFEEFRKVIIRIHRN